MYVTWMQSAVAKWPLRFASGRAENGSTGMAWSASPSSDCHQINYINWSENPWKIHGKSMEMPWKCHLNAHTCHIGHIGHIESKLKRFKSVERKGHHYHCRASRQAGSASSRRVGNTEVSARALKFLELAGHFGIQKFQNK